METLKGGDIQLTGDFGGSGNPRKLFQAAMASHFSSGTPWGFAICHLLVGYLTRLCDSPRVNIGSQCEANSDSQCVLYREELARSAHRLSRLFAYITLQCKRVSPPIAVLSVRAFHSDRSQRVCCHVHTSTSNLASTKKVCAQEALNPDSPFTLLQSPLGPSLPLHYLRKPSGCCGDVFNWLLIAQELLTSGCAEISINLQQSQEIR
jgi:hypothetical protein